MPRHHCPPPPHHHHHCHHNLLTTFSRLELLGYILQEIGGKQDKLLLQLHPHVDEPLRRFITRYHDYSSLIKTVHKQSSQGTSMDQAPHLLLLFRLRRLRSLQRVRARAQKLNQERAMMSRRTTIRTIPRVVTTRKSRSLICSRYRTLLVKMFSSKRKSHWTT